MSDQYNITTGGGNYIGSIQGNYIQGNYVNNSVEDNSINLNQDFSHVVASIEALLAQLQAQGYGSADAQRKVADTLVAKVQHEPSRKERLIKFLGNSAASGLVGDGAVEVVRLALRLLGV